MKKTFLLLFICVFMISCSDDNESDIQDDPIEMNDTSDDSNNDSDNNNNDSNSNDDSNNDSDNSNDDDGNDDSVAKLTYTKDISPIISSNCFNCHGASTRNGAPFSLNTYNDVSSRSSRIDARMNNASSPMPTSGLISQELRDQFKQWITDGKLE